MRSGLAAGQLGGAVEAGLVDRHDGEALPVDAQGPAQVVALRPGRR